MSKYTTKEKVESYLQRKLNSNELGSIEGMIDAVSTYIATYCHRDWVSVGDRSVTSSTRLFDGQCSQFLYTDDFKDLTLIELLDSQGNAHTSFDNTNTTDFSLLPNNSTIKDTIMLRSTRFSEGVANVRITAIFTSGEVPSTVAMVATQLVARMVTNSQSEKVANVKSKQLKDYSVTYQNVNGIASLTESEMILIDPYKKISLI
jgi:hypothetical protein